MILPVLILILLGAGILSWVTGRYGSLLPRVISLAAISADLILLALAWMYREPSAGSAWQAEFRAAWIPQFGISLHLAMDGLSMLLLALTFFLGIISVVISWKEISEKTGFFHFNLLWILAGIAGVFLSMDLFLFYFFWEMMLVPMYFLIGIWGHENRIYASYKFFIYTQAGGLLMFIAILALYFIHGRATGSYTFDYQSLLGTPLSDTAGMLLMLGFLGAFLIKLPVVPLHNWLPDAHTEAPTAGSVILAGLLLKTGAYGLLRFVIPLFPHASHLFAPIGMILGIVGILYGAKLAYAQTDLKRLVAYTSVSHMGFVILGVFTFNLIALQGVVMQIIAHAISTGALFILVGQLQERIHTRDLNRMGGLWTQVPVMGSMGLVFSLASLGLPGFGNFIAEFFVLTGTFSASIWITCLAGLGLVASMIYSLRVMQKVFFGARGSVDIIPDFSWREKAVYASLVVVIFYTGLFPQRIIHMAEPSLSGILGVSGKPVPVQGTRTRQQPAPDLPAETIFYLTERTGR
jgi:NADH-quinone oxidoreductase subunit M